MTDEKATRHKDLGLTNIFEEAASIGGFRHWHVSVQGARLESSAVQSVRGVWRNKVGDWYVVEY